MVRFKDQAAEFAERFEKHHYFEKITNRTKLGLFDHKLLPKRGSIHFFLGFERQLPPSGRNDQKGAGVDAQEAGLVYEGGAEAQKLVQIQRGTSERRAGQNGCNDT